MNEQLINPDDLYTLSEYAKMTGKAPSTVHYMMNVTKSIKTVSVNGATLIHAPELSKNK